MSFGGILCSVFQGNVNNAMLFGNGQCCPVARGISPAVEAGLGCRGCRGAVSPWGHLLPPPPPMAHMSLCDKTTLLIHTTTSASVCVNGYYLVSEPQQRFGSLFMPLCP